MSIVIKDPRLIATLRAAPVQRAGRKPSPDTVDLLAGKTLLFEDGRLPNNRWYRMAKDRNKVLRTHRAPSGLYVWMEVAS